MNDGVYAVPGFLLVAAGASRARFVGYRPGVKVRWQIDRHAYSQADDGVTWSTPVACLSTRPVGPLITPSFATRRRGPTEIQPTQLPTHFVRTMALSLYVPGSGADILSCCVRAELRLRPARFVHTGASRAPSLMPVLADHQSFYTGEMVERSPEKAGVLRKQSRGSRMNFSVLRIRPRNR